MTDWEIYDNTAIQKDSDGRRSHYDLMLRRYAMSMYRWDGLDSYLLEKLLFDEGRAVIFQSKYIDGLAIGSVTAEKLDALGEVKTCIPSLPYNDKLGSEGDRTVGKDCVIVYDTLTRIKRSSLMIGTDIMGEIDESVRVQTDNQKFPLLAVCDDSSTGGGKMEQLKVFVKAIYQGAKCLFIPSSVASSLTTLELNKDYNAQTLLQTKRSILNDNLTQLGIDSQDAYPKAERKIVSEQEGNIDELWLARQDGYKAREDAMKKTNELFNSQVKVTCVLDDVPQPVTGNEGGVQNGQPATD